MTAPSDPLDPLIGRLLPGGLRVLERVGTSTEGPLYRAQYSQPGPPVALTILRGPASDTPAGISSLSDRHWRHLRQACQIRDPHVAGLLDVGETAEGLVYVVSELLTGELLSDMISSGGAVPRPQAVDICLQAAAGLQAAHRAGVVHGRLSPETILITPGLGDGVWVKLVRFDFSGNDPDAAQVTDSPYASPERQAGHPPDSLDDVYSLGAVLHQLLTGAPPANESGLLGIPEELGHVVRRALASRGWRYSSAAAFAEELGRSMALPTAGHRRLARRLGGALATAAVIAAAVWFARDRLGAEASEHGSEVAARSTDAPTDSQPTSAPADAGPADTGRADTGRADTGRADTGPVDTGPPDAAPPDTRRAEAAPAAPAPPDTARPQSPPPGSARKDTSPGALLSPFRRSHPWAARPDGRIYFRSSCPLALQSPDLLYFKTEAEARATGRSRSTEPGCS